MVGRNDIDRIVAEVVARLDGGDDDGDRIGEWLERERIEEDAIQHVGDAIVTLWMESIRGIADQPEMTGREQAENALVDMRAGILMAFCIGWESCAAYRQPRE